MPDESPADGAAASAGSRGRAGRPPARHQRMSIQPPLPAVASQASKAATSVARSLKPSRDPPGRRRCPPGALLAEGHGTVGAGPVIRTLT